MKIHPKAKKALRYLIHCEKSMDFRKMFSVDHEIATEELEKYAPEISARFDCINSQTIEEAEHADAWFNYSYKEYMIQDHHNVKHVDVFHQILINYRLQRIPF
jgi:hypothetical protein